jgi:hypothetical protein
MKKTRAQKSRATVPLREEISLYRRKIEVYLENSLRSILWDELFLSRKREVYSYL